MAFEDLLVHVCEIDSFSVESIDAHGNPVKTWTASYSNQPCRLGRQAGRQLWNGAQLEMVDIMCYLPGDVSIREEDRVIWEGQTFKVLMVDHVHDSTAVNHHYEVSLQILRPSSEPT